MSMTIDGRSLSALGMAARELEGWLHGPAMARAVTAVPQLIGVSPSDVAVAQTRQMRVVASVKVDALTDRDAALHSIIDAVYGRLLMLRFDDTPGRIVRSVLGDIAVASVAPGISMNTYGKNLVVVLQFLAYDNASYDDEPRVIALSTTAAEIALGTLPSPGIVQWSGSWSTGASRTLTYTGANGIDYGELTLTAPADPEESPDSLSSSEFLEIDLARRYITHVSNTGVRTNAYDWKSGGAWFTPEPSDGNRAADVWPTLTLSAGAGTYLYRRAYLL